MPATQTAHGVITIHAPVANEVAAAPSYAPSVGALASHAISTGAPPEPVIQYAPQVEAAQEEHAPEESQ